MTTIHEYTYPTLKKIHQDYTTVCFPLAAKNIKGARYEVKSLGEYIWGELRNAAVYVDDIILTNSSTISRLFNTDCHSSYYLVFYIKDRYMFLKNSDEAKDYKMMAKKSIVNFFKAHNVTNYMIKDN